MTAPNHALTGAVIGLSVANPLVALPLAFLSHFVCDALPHYNPAESDMVKLYRSRAFIRDFLIIGAGLCVFIVVSLALAKPVHWATAALCAFLATSPDLFWLPLFLKVRRTGQKSFPKGWFFWLHDRVQWSISPTFIWLEAAWFLVFGAFLLIHL